LIHGLPPLRLIGEDKKLYIPKREFLNDYRGKLWSAHRDEFLQEHYDLARDVFSQLADELITSINELWDKLIDLVATELPKDIDEVVRAIERETIARALQPLPKAEYRPASGYVYVQPKPDTNLGQPGSATKRIYTGNVDETQKPDWTEPGNYVAGESRDPF